MTKKKQSIALVEKEKAPAEEALDSIKNLFETPQSIEKLIHTTTAKHVFTVLGQFAELDHQQEQQSAVAGEVFAKILALPLDAQKQLVWAMADHLGVPRPSYESTGAGRKTKGRNELSQVVYAQFPDMHDKKGANKDTIAAKRITDHVRRYLARSGQAPVRGKRATDHPAVPMGAVKKVFRAMWEASSESEHRVLVAIMLRLEVAPELMDKWTERGLLRLAAAPMSAITVEPVKSIEHEEKKAVG